MTDQLTFILENIPTMLFGFPGQRPGGMLLSLLLAILGIGLGYPIGLILAVKQQTTNIPSRWLARSIIETIRGLPLIILLVLIYQVSGIKLRPTTAAVIALSMYSGVYQAEILRSGLSAVPRSLIDSAKVMGTDSRKVFWRIKLPYTTRVMAPALINQAISLFKDTSVVIIIGVADLMTVSRTILGSDLSNAPYWMSLYAFLGSLYAIVALSISKTAAKWLSYPQLPSSEGAMEMSYHQLPSSEGAMEIINIL
jgi:His/Glu/Gln/Arg/opine family amino acid ABC transporter permease subunit